MVWKLDPNQKSWKHLSFCKLRSHRRYIDVGNMKMVRNTGKVYTESCGWGGLAIVLWMVAVVNPMFSPLSRKSTPCQPSETTYAIHLQWPVIHSLKENQSVVPYCSVVSQISRWGGGGHENVDTWVCTMYLVFLYTQTHVTTWHMCITKVMHLKSWEMWCSTLCQTPAFK
jgi:hypothetical protein